MQSRANRINYRYAHWAVLISHNTTSSWTLEIRSVLLSHPTSIQKLQQPLKTLLSARPKHLPQVSLNHDNAAKISSITSMTWIRTISRYWVLHLHLASLDNDTLLPVLGFSATPHRLHRLCALLILLLYRWGHIIKLLINGQWRWRYRKFSRILEVPWFCYRGTRMTEYVEMIFSIVKIDLTNFLD